MISTGYVIRVCEVKAVTQIGRVTGIVDHVNLSDITENQSEIITQLLQNLVSTRETHVQNRKFLPKPKFNKTFFHNLNISNKYLPTILETQETLREINDLVYAAAKTLIIANDQKPYHKPNCITPTKDPPWKNRIKGKVEDLRKEIGRLLESKNNRVGRRKKGTINKLYNKYNIYNAQDLENTIEILKQRIKLYAGRIKRYEQMNAKKNQNAVFKVNQHRFYRSIGHKTNIVTDIPEKQETQDFWRHILSQPTTYNKDAKWVTELEANIDNIEQHNFQEISTDKVKSAIRKTHSWKAPGIDKIQNYYLKYFTTTHKYLAKVFDSIFKGDTEIEPWFTTGEVILIPKQSSNTKDPKNWRPIACLPTMYKVLTSVLADELHQHCERNFIMAPEQRYCMRGSKGCKDHLMVNKAIIEDAHEAHKNLSMSWIDYQKAFDSISHDWLLKVLELYKCSDAVSRFLRMVMPNWKVVMTAYGQNCSTTTDPIHIKRGLFQGDSLSPLLFCLAINPLSQLLSKCITKGYKLKDRTHINHLLYMDDLKLYANSKNNLEALINTTEIFTNDIGMTFGLNKCNVLHMIGGRKSESLIEGQVLLSGQEFACLQEGEQYKYLGIHESGKINHAEIKQQLQKEYFRRLKALLNSHLSARNLITAINTYAMPVLLYSFGIINYTQRDLQKIDVKTRKLLAINKMHQQKAEVERLYLPLEDGGRGLTKIESLHNMQIIKAKQYLENSSDYIVNAIKEHDKNANKYSITKEANKYIQELKLHTNENNTDTDIKKAIKDKQIQTWKSKPLHNQFHKLVLEKENIDTKLSFSWLKKQLISPTLEAAVFAIQDQSIVTKQFERDIAKKTTDGKCRVCAAKDETIQHIASGCEKLAGTHYVRRHNNIVQYVFWTLKQKHKFQSERFWWKDSLTQPIVIENDTAKLMWEIPVQTDITVNHNRPDIIYINKTQNKTYLIDVTIPCDYNIGAKEIEKLTKYHLLKKEIARLWKTNTEIIPIVIGGTGMVAKSIRRYCDKLDSDININIIQKQVAIHTTNLVAKVLGDTILIGNDK